jgi:hypothetical protein
MQLNAFLEYGLLEKVLNSKQEYLYSGNIKYPNTGQKFKIWKCNLEQVGSEVLKAVIMKTVVFWAVTSCRYMLPLKHRYTLSYGVVSQKTDKWLYLMYCSCIFITDWTGKSTTPMSSNCMLLIHSVKSQRWVLCVHPVPHVCLSIITADGGEKLAPIQWYNSSLHNPCMKLLHSTNILIGCNQYILFPLLPSASQ